MTVIYSVKEIFYTLQGEGAQAGRAAVFCRFAGCNLWSGREPDRATAACHFCDTNFVGTDGTDGGKYLSASALADTILQRWQGESIENHRFVVLTGGEPLLQVDTALIAALHERGFEVAVETNGTLPAPEGLDWICVSPKAGNPLVQLRGHELKVVVPQPTLDMTWLSSLDFAHHWVQPMDSPTQQANIANTQWAIHWCLAHPKWRLSVQTHKALGIR